MSFDLMCYSVIFTWGLLGISKEIDKLREHYARRDEIPEGGGMCECGEYYHRMIIRREDELKRIEEEKRKGNSYDTTL